ncbi:MAG: DMT family transporter [Pirellulales bacterium]
MSDEQPLKTFDVFWMILLGAIWGGSFLFMRISVKEFGPIPLIQVRVAVGAAFLLIVVFWQRKQSLLLTSPWKMLFVGLTNSAVPYTLFALGTKLLSSGFAAILNATSPFFGALIALIVFHERLPIIKWIGLMIGFVGVVVLVVGNVQLEGSSLGVLVCLLAAMSYAVAAHFTKRQLGGVDPMITATGCQLTAALAMIPAAIYTWPEQSPSANSWLAVIALGVLCTGAALAIYFHLIQAIGATRSISSSLPHPAFGVLWGCLFLDEQLSLAILAGGSLILGGLFFVSRTK